MPVLNWGLIHDGGVLESLMHAILYAEDPQTILFGRPGKDAGQDARTADGFVVYQSKYRNGLDMDGAVDLALEELEKIKKYRGPNHANHEHWKNAKQWVLFANLSINPNDDAKWKKKVVPEFALVGLAAGYWTTVIIEGKLAEKPEVREVFFGQENRVLVSLKEAHDLLKNERIGSDSLDTPMLGRDAELALVKAFIDSSEKRVLPVIGPGGIGKSRFLYESLVSLSQDGWRVLWGLPSAMAKSSQWFRLLNGTQKTCVALDDPDDPGLLRAVIEQLSTVERCHWRVIIACRTDRSDVLRRYKTKNSVEEAIRLDPLSESDSKALINGRLGFEADEARLHQAFRLTQGNPGWLSLFAELAKQGKLTELPPTADDIAALYVTTCLENLEGATANQARILLRWLALWGSLVIEAGSEERDEIAFLENAGIPKEALRDLLKRLVETGLVRNWGIGKRLYGIESLLIRQHILSEWLLQRAGLGEYSVSPAGTDLVSKLVSSDLPCFEATLQTISHLSLSRLESQEVYSLLRPIFSAMVATAKDASLFTQNHLAELVAKLGPADPESALDVLIAVRENMKEREEIEDPFWGKQTFTQDRLLTTLSWTLFNIAESVDDTDVASRFLLEFRELFKVVESGLNPDEQGKSPQQLLERLLCNSRRSGLFAQPAYNLASDCLLSEEWWPFVGVLAKCVMQPIRQLTEWVASSTLGFKTYAIAPGSPEWGYLLNLRVKLFEILTEDHPADVHYRIWTLLAEAHHSIHGAVARVKVPSEWEQKYREVRVSDLKQCSSILKGGRSFAEATRARPMWEWYLKYGNESELVASARECEQTYSSLSKWRIQDFFRFDYDEELKRETDRVVELLRNDPNPAVYQEFFDEAERYLKAVRNGRDMADDWRFSELAAALADDFSLDDGGEVNAFSSFVLSILKRGEEAEKFRFPFAVLVCRTKLARLKADKDFVPGDWFEPLLQKTPSKANLLYQLYSNAHPDSMGSITEDDAQRILTHKDEFHIRRKRFRKHTPLLGRHRP